MDTRKLKTNLVIIIALVAIVGGYLFFFLSPRIFSADESNLLDTPISEVIKIDNDHTFAIEAWEYSEAEKKMGLIIALNSSAANPSEKYVYQVTSRNKAKDKNIAGRVFIGFVVEKDGSINEVKVLRGIGGGCDEEAVRVIKSMPKWKPGIQKGKPVRVSFQMPFVFKLDESAASKSGLVNNTYMGKETGTKDGVTYTMKMTMEFESNTTGYFVMTLTSQKKNGESQVEFQDVGLPFTYTYDGKSSGSIQPTNPDGSQLGEEPMAPYGFIVEKDGSIQVSLYDMKEDIGVEKMVFKKVVK